MSETVWFVLVALFAVVCLFATRKQIEGGK